MVVLASLAALVSGCSLLALEAKPSPEPTATESADPVPLAQQLAQQLPDRLVAGRTLATGRIAAVTGDGPAGPRVTGDARLVVNSAQEIELRIRPDAQSATNLTGFSFMLTTTRYDGGPETIQTLSFGLIPNEDGLSPEGELVTRVPPGLPSAGDPSYMRSIEENYTNDARVVAAAPIAWSLPSAFPGLHAVDHGVVTYAHGRTIVEDGVLTGYVPNPYDTIYMVSRRFGLAEVQLLWLNPWLLLGSSEPELKSGIGVNLDPARR
jgi:hypothetical protein